MVVYNAPFLDPKAPSVVARAVELRVRPRATHNDNVGGNSAISSVHAGAKALEGNIEKWDFMMLLFALLNSAHSLTEGRGDLAATLDNKAGMCRVRNEAFRHVESTQLLDQRMPPALRWERLRAEAPEVTTPQIWSPVKVLPVDQNIDGTHPPCLVHGH